MINFKANHIISELSEGTVKGKGFTQSVILLKTPSTCETTQWIRMNQKPMHVIIHHMCGATFIEIITKDKQDFF